MIPPYRATRGLGYLVKPLPEQLNATVDFYLGHYPKPQRVTLLAHVLETLTANAPMDRPIHFHASHWNGRVTWGLAWSEEG